ncbi:lipid phosphate phosphatase-related protein type 1/2/5 [Sarotherodon galilaeus]
MAHLIHLSLVLAVRLLPCVSAIRDFPNGGIKFTPYHLCPVGGNITHDCNCTAGKWIWKFKCCGSTVNQVTLEATATANYTETEDCTNKCRKITYKTKMFVLSVEVENGYLKHTSDNKVICESCSATSTTAGTKCNSFKKKQKIQISVPKRDQNTVKLTFKKFRQQHRVSECIEAHTGSTDRPCNVSVATTNTVTNLEFYHENKSWIDALEQCQTDYTSLVEITNQTVKDEVKSLLQNETHLQRGVWIGLERSVFGKDKEWMWISKSKHICPEWNRSIADSNNHCAKIILTEKQEIKLLDANCHDRLPFICQDSGEEAS